MLTILPLIAITLTISFPSVNFLTFSSARAFSFKVSSESLIFTLIVARSLPFT